MLREIVRTQKQKSLAGVFKRYADKKLIEKESEIAWEKALCSCKRLNNAEVFTFDKKLLKCLEK